MFIEKPIDSAIKCLTRLSSFLSFEDLTGCDSHLSRVFHDVCVENQFALISIWHDARSFQENLQATASMLTELASREFVSILLMAHQSKCVEHSEKEPGNLHKNLATSDFSCKEFALFISYPKSPISFEREWQTKIRQQLLSIARIYGENPVAITERGKLRVLKPTGEEVKSYNPSTMKPQHLRRVLSATRSCEFDRLQSGFLTGAPVSLCGIAYQRAGLRSDIPIGLIGRAFRSVRDSISERLYEPYD